MTPDQSTPPIKLPTRPAIQPFSDDELALMDKIEAMGPHLQDLLHRAKYIGQDVPAYIQQIQQHQDNHDANMEAVRRLKVMFAPPQLDLPPE